MKRRARNGPANRFRIIGGEWRGRRFGFPAGSVIRPTPDRVRETLFNWLTPVMDGARCLDLYAGSGALGLEALSRGASHCDFVERDAAACAELRGHLVALGTPPANVVCADARAFLRSCGATFDIVFLDPPFDTARHEKIMAAVEESGVLAPRARIYLELPARRGTPEMPATWNLVRSKRAGQVGYHLAERDPGTGTP